MKRYTTISLALAIALAACSAAQLQTATEYQAKIAHACGVAMTLAPLAGPYASWIIGGCASEAAIAKLALDPFGLEWVNGLVTKVNAAGRI